MSHGWVYVHIKLQLSKSKHRHPLGFGWKRARENLSEQVEHVGVSNVAMFAWHLGFEWNAVETVGVVAAYIGVGNGGAMELEMEFVGCGIVSVWLYITTASDTIRHWQYHNQQIPFLCCHGNDSSSSPQQSLILFYLAHGNRNCCCYSNRTCLPHY